MVIRAGAMREVALPGLQTERGKELPPGWLVAVLFHPQPTVPLFSYRGAKMSTHVDFTAWGGSCTLLDEPIPVQQSRGKIPQ